MLFCRTLAWWVRDGKHLSKPTERTRASQVVVVVKNLPAMQETQETRVPSLGQEDLLEAEMTSHCSILA